VSAPTRWGWPDAVAAVNRAPDKTLRIGWNWYHDQRRKAAIRAVKLGHLERMDGKPGAGPVEGGS